LHFFHNAFFPEDLELERSHDQAHLSTAEYAHIWLGRYYDELEGSIIPVDWFDGQRSDAE
jgi:hypothetical protein